MEDLPELIDVRHQKDVRHRKDDFELLQNVMCCPFGFFGLSRRYALLSINLKKVVGWFLPPCIYVVDVWIEGVQFSGSLVRGAS